MAVQKHLIALMSVCTAVVVAAVAASGADHTQVAQTIDHQVILASAEETSISLVVREVIAERIPLTVSYEVVSSSLPLDDADFSWVFGAKTSQQPSPEFVMLEEGPFGFELELSVAGEVFDWKRDRVTLPLHDNTEIMCDVQGFGIDPDEVASVRWSVRNWEMGTPATMTLWDRDSPHCNRRVHCSDISRCDVRGHVQEREH